MEITLRLFAGLRGRLPEGGRGGEARLEVGEGERVGDVIARLELPAEVKLLIFINGRHAGTESALAEGDELSIFPPIAGG